MVPATSTWRRCLLCEHNAAAAAAFAQLAEASGFQVTHVSTPGEALRRVAEQRFAIVLLPIDAPGTSDSTVIDAILRRSPGVVFILVAGPTSAIIPDRFSDHPEIVAVLTTPWNTEAVSAKLRRAYDLHARRAADACISEQSQRVLLVEDDETDQLILQRYIGKLGGYSVTAVSNIREATQRLHDGHFDLVITDLALPDARGFDAILILTTVCQDSALVVCSGVTDQHLSLQLIELGADEILPKDDLSVATVNRALSFACERRNNRTRLARKAYLDPLTGLYNRAGWETFGAPALVMATRHRQRAWIIALDLDGFKGVNDQFGHAMGNTLLQAVAIRLRRYVRPYDAVARLGGDEFAILISDIDGEADFLSLAERLVSSLARPYELPVGTINSVTASLGAASYLGGRDTLAAVLDRADQAMYESKRAGKNRLTVCHGARVGGITSGSERGGNRAADG